MGHIILEYCKNALHVSIWVILIYFYRLKPNSMIFILGNDFLEKGFDKINDMVAYSFYTISRTLINLLLIVSLLMINQVFDSYCMLNV